MKLLRAALPVLLALGIGACSDVRVTDPERTATEQLLISTAADKAIEQFAVNLPHDTPVWLDASRFDGYDEGYAIGAIRAYLLEHGAALVSTREAAQVIVEARAGALSINRREDFLGMPGIAVPVPLSGNLELPELALLKRHEQLGVAKFALTAYRADSGRLLFNEGPTFGLAWRDRWAVLGIGWTEGDVRPEDATPPTP